MEPSLSNKEWRKKSMTWGKRLLMVVLVLGVAIYAVLSLAVRSKDAIRKGLEDAIEQATGEDAEITDVVSVTLVPDIMFRVRGGVLRDAQTRKISLMKVEKGYLSMPLWRMMVGSSWYNGIELQGVETATGFFLPKKLSLDFAGISDPSGGVDAPQFLAEGTYNGKELLLTAEMARKGGKKPLYGFRDIFPVTLKLGDLEGHGFYVREWSRIDLKDIIITRGAHSARLSVTDFGRNPLKGTIAGTLDDIPFTGRFDQLGEDNIVLIKPERDARIFEAFADALEKDMGFADDDAAFKIDVEDDTKEPEEK